MSYPQLPPAQMLAAAVARFPPVELRTSASAIENFRLCKRKWAFDYIDKSPRAQTEAAILGDRVHKLRENYLLYGVWPTRATWEGTIALAGIEHLPPPRLPIVEHKFDFGFGPHIRFRGRIDFLVPNDDRSGRRNWGTFGIPLVGDHKTTSKYDYVKTPEKLAGDDPQGAIYPAYAQSVTGANFVDLHWSYMIKLKPQPRPKQVYVRLSRGQVEESFGHVVNTAQEMLTLVQINGIRAAQVEPDPRGCEAFGGCPYKAICPLTDSQRFGAFMFDPNQQQPAFNPQNGFAPNGQQPQMMQQQQQQQQLQQQQQQPSFAPQMQQPQMQQLPQGQMFTPPGANLNNVLGAQPSAQLEAPQRSTDGTWWQRNPATGQYTQCAAPAAGTGQVFETPAEITLAAQLVHGQQPLPSSASPGLVKAYAGFIQQPQLALSYLQAAAAASQMQNPMGATQPSTGVVPPDAPVANTQSTKDEMKAAEKAAKEAAKAAKVNLSTAQTTDAVHALVRIANAVEELVRQATYANGPPAAQQIAGGLPPNITTFQQQPGFTQNFQQQPTFPPAGQGG